MAGFLFTLILYNTMKYLIFGKLGTFVGIKVPRIILIFQILMGVLVATGFVVRSINAQDIAEPYDLSQAKELAVISGNSLAPVANPYMSAAATVSTMKVVITAYSSTPDQTDDTPFTTASGSMVRDGVVANNLLPLGTKVRIPAIYGDKIFDVEDRMNRRMGNYRLDIWFPSTQEAKKFGVKTTTIEVVEW